MSNIDDDDDDFLYGDDAAPVNATPATETVEQQKPETTGDAATESTAADEASGDEDDESGSDSDSDIEFIIGSEEPKNAPVVATATDAASTAADAQTAAGVVPEAIGEVSIQTEDKALVSTSTETTITRVPGIDINKPGVYEGKPITEMNLQDLKEKPWRQPGADVSEYFNFGFNELSWMMYVQKQDKLRSQFDAQKVMMELMPLAMMGNMPMPPLPNMPAGFPQMPIPPQQGTSNSGTPQPPSGPRYNQDHNMPRAPGRQNDPRERFNRSQNNDNYRDRDRDNGRYNRNYRGQ